ncbi:MAG TPA: hypothetical protein VFK86_00725, partial [Bauldia sp.]|nr:hypothetical protein [Bauldia sp.]
GAPTAGEFVPSLQSSTALFLDDANSDGQDYTYCLTVEPNMISADGKPAGLGGGLRLQIRKFRRMAHRTRICWALGSLGNHR